MIHQPVLAEDPRLLKVVEVEMEAEMERLKNLRAILPLDAAQQFIEWVLETVRGPLSECLFTFCYDAQQETLWFSLTNAHKQWYWERVVMYKLPVYPHSFIRAGLQYLSMDNFIGPQQCIHGPTTRADPRATSHKSVWMYGVCLPVAYEALHLDAVKLDLKLPPGRWVYWYHPSGPLIVKDGSLSLGNFLVHLEKRMTEQAEQLLDTHRRQEDIELARAMRESEEEERTELAKAARASNRSC